MRCGRRADRIGGAATTNVARVEEAGASTEVVPQRRTIVTAMPLKRTARRRLAELLEARVIDVREPLDERPDMVLTPACSPQLIGALRDKYDGAQVVVVELDDWEFDIELPGPVKRVLRSGAAAYVLADSIDELAAKLSVSGDDGVDRAADALAPGSPAELSGSPAVDEIITAFLRQSAERVARRD